MHFVILFNVWEKMSWELHILSFKVKVNKNEKNDLMFLAWIRYWFSALQYSFK